VSRPFRHHPGHEARLHGEVMILTAAKPRAEVRLAVRQLSGIGSSGLYSFASARHKDVICFAM
jgi:hypothetical protein